MKRTGKQQWKKKHQHFSKVNFSVRYMQPPILKAAVMHCGGVMHYDGDEAL